MTCIFLCRHCETSTCVRGRCHGRLDAGLSSRGRRQAVQLAETLAGEGLAAVYTSPLRRARETAKAVAERHGLAPISVDGLSEIDLGQFEGLTYEEAERQFPEVYRLWMAQPLRVRFPGGEDYDVLRRRAAVAIDEIGRCHPEEAVAVVTHAGPLRTLGIELAYGCVTAISRS